MPGDLRGITPAAKRSPSNLWMMNVELQDDAGNKLQVASGQQPRSRWAVPSALQGTAPATIPLWYSMTVPDGGYSRARRPPGERYIGMSAISPGGIMTFLTSLISSRDTSKTRQAILYPIFMQYVQ